MSDTDSDCEEFLSADEFSDAEAVILPKDITLEKELTHDNVVSDDAQQSKTVHCVVESELEDDDDSDNEIKSYRKRPERKKRSSPPSVVNTELKPIIDIVRKPDLTPIIDIVKVARPDVIVNNLTSHLTKGIASFQETSSSITGLVMKNFGGAIGGEKFVYDRNITEREVVDIVEEAAGVKLPGVTEFVGELKGTDEETISNDRNVSESDDDDEEDHEKRTEQSAKVLDKFVSGTNAVDYVATENLEMETENDATKSSSEVVCESINIEALIDTKGNDSDEDIVNRIEMKSSITDEILKLSEAFEKLKQNRLSEEVDLSLNDDRLDEIVHDVDNEIKASVSQEETDFSSICKFVSKKEVPGIVAEKPQELDQSSTIKNSSTSFLHDSEDYRSEISCASALVPEKQEKNSSNDEKKLVCDELPIDFVAGAESLEDSKNQAICRNKEGNINVQIENKINKLEKDQELDGWDDWPSEEDEENVNDVNLVSSSKENETIENEKLKMNLPTSQAPAAPAEDRKKDQEDEWPDWELENDEKEAKEDNDGWGDWDVEMEEPSMEPDGQVFQPKISETVNKMATSKETRPLADALPSPTAPEWTGWDSFGEKKEANWGLSGWGINTLLSKATSVTNNLSAVIETGLGVPDPSTMARIHAEEGKARKESGVIDADADAPGFPFINIVSGVGKIVEVSKVQQIGSRVLSGGLDTLESIGKKTMEVLQDGDPGLKKKKALLMGKGQMLSDVLKEARDRAIQEDKKAARLSAVRRCNFETLFDDYQGLVHLEALEMLSRQCELRLEQIQQGLSAAKLRELNDTLEEISQLCEIDDDIASNIVEDYEAAIEAAAQPLSEELSVTKILEIDGRMKEWCAGAHSMESTAVYDHAIAILAEMTTAVTMQFHKCGELMLLKQRRKTVEEADALLELSGTICWRLMNLSDEISELLARTHQGEVEQLTENLRIETGNAVAYIKQAFTLLVPVLQLGAT